MSLVVGVDLGGTKIAAGLVDADGRIRERRTVPTPAHSAAAVLDAVVQLVDDWATSGSVDAVGVAAAGFLDADRTTLMRGTNLPWRGEPFVEPLRERWGCPVVLDNDATAAAWGEVCFGSGRGIDDFVLITVGTGIGGGVVTGGRLVHGGFAAAGEIGHVRFERDGRPCGCGQRGCWEQYGSGQALTAALAEAGLTRDDLADDARAQHILADFAAMLGEGAATLLAVLDPEVVALGGGVIAGNPQIIGSVESAIHRFAPAADERRPVRVVAATLGNDAGLVGVAQMAREERSWRA